MVTIRLGTLDLARVRFAFSPLWECVAAFRIWRRARREPLHLPWADAIDPRVRDEGWRRLEQVLLAPGGSLPDFVAPPPSRPRGTLTDELDAMTRADARTMRAEIARAWRGRVPEDLRRELRNPARFLGHIAAQLHRFWTLAVEPVWPRILARVEGEVVHRSRLLALEGSPRILRDLHADVRYVGGDRAGVLHIKAGDTVNRRAQGAGVLLVPSVFAWPEVFAVARHPWRPTVAYPARGIVDVWEQASRTTRNGVMTELLGATRSRLLVRLVLPQTTTELSAALRLSPAAVSEQLSALTRAGVTTRSRVGRRVYYALSERGAAVVLGFSANRHVRR